jgi:hypothetical protein
MVERHSLAGAAPGGGTGTQRPTTLCDALRAPPPGQITPQLPKSLRPRARATIRSDPMQVFVDFETVKRAVVAKLGGSEWGVVSQAGIDRFAEA